MRRGAKLNPARADEGPPRNDAPPRARCHAQHVSPGAHENPSIANTGTEGGKNAGAGYPNGRRPNDDVVDTFLTMVNSGVFQGDAVNDNEVPFKDAFPFFANPHMPFPPGSGRGI